MCIKKEREGLSPLGKKAFALVRGDREDARELAMEGISQATGKLQVAGVGEETIRALAAIESASVVAEVAMRRDAKSTDLIFRELDRKKKMGSRS